ncbi:MAG: GNAT family N-acetyltransferase [Nocardioides sp.]
MRRTHDGYELDDDPRRVDLGALWAYLSTEAYWGRFRTREDLAAQLASAWRVVGVYDAKGAQVGFARGISDGVALAYLADVYVLPEHRGRGLGHALMRVMVDEGPGSAYRWLLHTADAHDLYAAHGFRPADHGDGAASAPRGVRAAGRSPR